MTRISSLLTALVFCAAQAGADTLVAAHTIRAKAILGPEDLTFVRGDVPGALSDPSQAIGQEARVALYAGRPIRAGDIGPPALIERNQIVVLIYARGALRITADGRALDRAGIGDRIRVMNLSSRSTVTGSVQPDGTIHILNQLP